VEVDVADGLALFLRQAVSRITRIITILQHAVDGIQHRCAVSHNKFFHIFLFIHLLFVILPAEIK